MSKLRRSQRSLAALYDANGREYLAGELKYTRAELENWLASPTVHRHLLSWHNICISGKRRYNEALQWLEGGNKSYFYTNQALQSFNCGEISPSCDKEDLEEDLLLICLGEGNIDDPACGDESGFADENLDTRNMPAQTLWARTAWRIIQDNRAIGQVFEEASAKHPAAAYAFAIDILCIAFHSIACRKSDSVWHELIMNGAASPTFSVMANEVLLDQSDEDGGEDNAMQSEGESEASFEGENDEDYELPHTPVRSKNFSRVETPSAPRKVKRTDSAYVQTDDWLHSLPEADFGIEDDSTEENQVHQMLYMVDGESGDRIKGCRIWS